MGRVALTLPNCGNVLTRSHQDATRKSKGKISEFSFVSKFQRAGWESELKRLPARGLSVAGARDLNSN